MLQTLESCLLELRAGDDGDVEANVS
jgi:hypothetical protein